jgi:hypothetical protein
MKKNIYYRESKLLITVNVFLYLLSFGCYIVCYTMSKVLCFYLLKGNKTIIRTMSIRL